jgi:hypothetical protein
MKIPPDFSKAPGAGDRAWRAANGIRADKVAHARRLLNDPGYPGSEVLLGVAGLLARKLTRPGN